MDCENFVWMLVTEKAGQQLLRQLNVPDDFLVRVSLKEEPTPYSLETPVRTSPPTVTHAILHVVEIGILALDCLANCTCIIANSTQSRQFGWRRSGRFVKY